MIRVIQVHVHVCMYSALNQTEMVYEAIVVGGPREVFM